MRHARPRPPFDIHHPIVSPSGVAFFARDQHSSEQVWSREGGYPGNPYYRDFYRDIGYDLPEEQLHGEVGPFHTRVMTGLKYHRITGKTDQKLPYMPGVAADRAVWLLPGDHRRQPGRGHLVGRRVVRQPHGLRLVGGSAGLVGTPQPAGRARRLGEPPRAATGRRGRSSPPHAHLVDRLDKPSPAPDGRRGDHPSLAVDA